MRLGDGLGCRVERVGEWLDVDVFEGRVEWLFLVWLDGECRKKGD